ncbi:hypothetical protein B0A48_17100 [Cryoendolithus antarcticus]|uniref:BTB domain-containing protein n=1 Tax=Cryoendolithus antarcticus TaxID=1507870 RepID=A0A1V8SBI8_9PEZI|nr:hypothetical protein B0A48_17100 [Cryoendolithus antarcticus]
MPSPPRSPARTTDGVNKPPKRKFDYAEAISVIVGKEDTTRTFIVHQDLICAKSKIFKAACSTRWPEGQEKTVKLEVGNDNSPAHAIECMDVYLLAVRLDDTALRDHATIWFRNACLGTTMYCLGRTFVQCVYNSTVAGSNFRALMVDTY